MLNRTARYREQFPAPLNYYSGVDRTQAQSEACAMITVCWRFLCDESGATAIEYGLIVAGIAVAILGAIGTLSESVKTMLFDKISTALTS